MVFRSAWDIFCPEILRPLFVGSQPRKVSELVGWLVGCLIGQKRVMENVYNSFIYIYIIIIICIYEACISTALVVE